MNEIKTPPALDASKKVHIKTYGCQMNVYDSDRMRDALGAKGYTQTDHVEDADLVLFNTCHIREKASEKVYSEIGKLRAIRTERHAEGKDFKIGVAGCVAQAEGEEMLKRADMVDVIVGPQTYHRLPQLLDRAEKGERVIDIEYALEDKFDHLPKPGKERIRKAGVSAFLSVQEGCDKFCTFCVVPYTRGAEVSRPVAHIIKEAKRLVDSGVKEITLLGQNVNAWHGEGDAGDGTMREWGLGELLRELSTIEGIARLRYVTSHPRDMDDALIEAHRDLDVVMPYLHLPVQAGSDNVLKAMNRRHTADDYRAIIARVRDARPDIAISGDFIVGFPGETDQDFEDTMQLVRDIGYVASYSFKYSPRPGTPGAEMDNHVPEEIKTKRLHLLQELLNQQSQDFMAARIGEETTILLEKPGRDEGQMIGRSPWLYPVVIEGHQGAIGDLVPVRITRALRNSFLAEIMAP